MRIVVLEGSRIKRARQIYWQNSLSRARKKPDILLRFWMPHTWICTHVWDVNIAA